MDKKETLKKTPCKKVQYIGSYLGGVTLFQENPKLPEFLVISQNSRSIFPECYSIVVSPRYFVRVDINTEAVWRQVAHNIIGSVGARAVMSNTESHGVFRNRETKPVILHAALPTRDQIQTRPCSGPWGKCGYIFRLFCFVALILFEFLFECLNLVVCVFQGFGYGRRIGAGIDFRATAHH